MLKEFTFNYTGKVQTLIVPATGNYKLECFGASGGIGYGNANPFGLGGYACGEIKLNKGDILYVYVGEDGVNTITTPSFGGGGAAFSTSGHNGGRGGGASDIRLGSDDLKCRIIVAGGGGGAQPSCGGNHTTAGHGGGLIGAQSYNQAGGYAGSYANGGTQTAGGTSGNVSGQWHANGSFGYGANSQTCGAGGGGGWYGGGSTYTAGGGGGSSYLGTLKNSSTSSGINKGNGKVVISLIYDEVAFFFVKGEEYYLPIAKYFDIGTKMFKAVSLNDLRSEINNSNYGNVSLYNINAPFVIDSISYNPLDYLDISKCKICVIPNGSRANDHVKELDINYVPTSKALSKTNIKIKDMYTPYKDNIQNPFLNIEAANKANISFLINYENLYDIVNDDCSLIDKKLIKDNFCLSFKLNDVVSLLKSVSLCSRDINYFKIRDDDLNVSNDYINTQIAFEKEYSEILINRLTKQYFKYLDDNLDTF
jgi:hypothetical protein